jgi:hypothetical protein
MFQANVTAALPHPLSRSVSEYSLRDRAATFRSFPLDFPSHQLISSSNATYFCTYCSNGFQSRADWETHEWLFHERLSYWPCPYPGCESIFDSGSKFEEHHEASHRCLNCKHAAEVVRLLPERKAWACGFDTCKAVFVDWSKRCKHVAAHYEGLARRHGNVRDTPEWTYSNNMRNLLRLPEIRDPFKRFMIKCHGSSKAAWPKLEWRKEDTGELRRCLEYRDFRRGVSEVIHMAYRLGHPAYNAAVDVMSRPPTPPSERVSRSNSRLRSPSSSASDSPFSSGPGSPHRAHRPYRYERKQSLSTLPEWGPPPKDYLLSRSLPSSPPDASPTLTRSGSPIRTISIDSQMGSLRSIPKKRMVAREADVRGTGCGALIQFLRQGPPDAEGRAPTPVLEHRVRRIPSSRPLTEPDLVEEQQVEKEKLEDNNLEDEPVDEEEAEAESEIQVQTEGAEESLPSQESSDRQTPAAPPGSPILSASLTVSDSHSPAPSPLPTPTPTPLSLWPSPVTLSVWPTPELVSQDPSTIVTQLASALPPPRKSSLLPVPPPSPLPDMTGMDWPLPPPTSRATSPVPHPALLLQRPSTSAGEHAKRPGFSQRGKARSLRWVSISGLVEPPKPSPDVDFGSCLSQPLDLLQPARH